MSGIEYLAGTAEVINRPLPAYSPEAIDFLATLSRSLMVLPESRTYPDLMAAAFWCRRGNLMKCKGLCPEAPIRIGRGLAFHVTPSNIPINFAFSWFFSLLAGNANIVRLPSKRYPQAIAFCAAVNRLLPEYPEIQKRTALISYPASNETTAAFCANADARIIWGGDATIASVRQHPAKPRCVDLSFADRYSVCVLDGGAILQAEEGELQKLAEGFYNDTYLMDQNACSSPQLIFWSNDSQEARERFWAEVVSYAAGKYELQSMTAVDKYTQLCRDGICHPEINRVIQLGGNLLYRAELSSLSAAEGTSLRGRGGYFYEYSLTSLDELCPLVDEKYQTVTYYGIPAETLRRLVLEHQLQGIDRIVPVGSAMDIGIIWDGYDIVRMLSRIITA